MWHGLRFAAALIVAASALSAPVTAQAATGAQVRDPNEKICETVSQVGSRLSKKKVCATRAEWATTRKDEKETLEWIQRQGTIACMPEAQSSSAGSRC
jgi:signal-transduction protein with cAMP-binding, CBS, and nucleotidyltransferase domain